VLDRQAGGVEDSAFVVSSMTASSFVVRAPMLPS
jgi:hypothetical protein